MTRAGVLDQYHPGLIQATRAACLFLVTVAGTGCERRSDNTSASASANVSAATTQIEAPVNVWFEEVAEARGLSFHHDSGHQLRHYNPEIMVGGAALFDMDNDGDLDVYLVQSGSILTEPSDRPPNQLFENLGDGTFKDVTAGSGADHRGYGTGVATGDYDNDGDLDLYVTNVGRNILLRNDGGGRFTDVTATTGVGDEGYSSSAAFLDYDADGDLDLFVVKYLSWSVQTELDCRDELGQPDYCTPHSYSAPTADVLYRNDGETGEWRFTDVSVESGVAGTLGTGLGLACGDFTADGWIDIFVANDGMANRLWVNDGHGRFEDRAMVLGCAIDDEGKPKAGMGVAAIDLDDDGDLDLMVNNLTSESDSVYRNEHGRYFTDATVVSGLAATSRRFTRFGVGWVDFDNDGRLDLYQANGAVFLPFTAPLRADDPYAEPNLLFRGTAEGRFVEVEPRGGTTSLLVATSRAAAFGDIDNDGGIDILVVNRDGPAHLLLNVVEHRGHWLMFRVLDEHGRDAIGATVTLHVGERTMTRNVRTAYSYLAANDPRIHVGLGDHTGAENVTVRWVDGTR